MSILTNLKQWISSKRRGVDPVKESILVHEDGFTLSKADATIEVKWREVKRVFTYKLDCYGYDVILLGFEIYDRERLVQVSEEADDFNKLMLALAHAFPEIDPEWYPKVMQPPFAENFTILLAR